MKTECPFCGQHYEVEDIYKEQKVICDTCNKEFIAVERTVAPATAEPESTPETVAMARDLLNSTNYKKVNIAKNSNNTPNSSKDIFAEILRILALVSILVAFFLGLFIGDKFDSVFLGVLGGISCLGCGVHLYFMSKVLSYLNTISKK